VSSLTELMARLRAVEAKVDEGRRGITVGRRSLAESKAMLARLDPDHPETVVPPEMARADDQLERTLAQLAHVSEALRTFSAQL